VEANSTGGQGSRRAVAPRDDEIYPYTGLEKARGFLEVEAPRIFSRYKKVVRFSALSTGRLYLLTEYPWYSFLLQVESTPAPVWPEGLSQ
jgi:hypothetical protein